MMLPMILTIRIQRKDRGRVRLFLPVFLIWLILFPLMIVLSPLVLLAALFSWRNGVGKALLMTGPMLISLFFSLSGLRVEVQEKKSDIEFIMN